MQETWALSLSRKDPLEKEMASHYSILVWRIPWTGEPGRLQVIGLQSVRHDWVTSTLTCLRLAILGDICKMNGFLLCFLPSSHLWSILEPDIQSPIRWLPWDISLPSSRSAGFSNTVVFLASTHCLSVLLACSTVNRGSLDLLISRLLAYWLKVTFCQY